MLQQEQPEDFVISTGRMETVRSFIEICAKKLGWQKNSNGPAFVWEGKYEFEIGRRAYNNQIVIKVDPRYFRPAEVEELQGDSKKSFLKLGWKPEITLEEMIEEMIIEDKKNALRECLLLKKGFN